MIIPRERLLLAFGLLVLPPAFAGAFLPLGRLPAALAVFCLAVAAVDGICAALLGRGATLTSPGRLNLVRNRPGALVLRAGSGRTKPVPVEIGIELPAGCGAEVPVAALALPGGDRPAEVPFQITGSVRGLFRPGRCVFRMRSPLGLWFVQTSWQLETEIHVYPNLSLERKRLAALLSGRNEVRHPRRQVGQGKEFEKLRQYAPGDSQGDIHWKATAKLNRLIVKEFQIERSQEVYAVLDTSRLSRRPVSDGAQAGDALLEHYLQATLTLGLAAQGQGDQFGLATFSDRPERFLRAQGGKLAFARCREQLYNLQSAEVSPDFDELVAFLSRKLHRRALILIMTSLDEPLLAENFLRSIRVLSRRHLVLVGMVRPAGARPLFAGGGDDLYRDLGGHLLWHTLRELKQSLRLQGVELLLMDDARFCSDLVSAYLDVKRRQIL